MTTEAMCSRCGFSKVDCRCVSDVEAVDLADSADAFLRSLTMGCRCGHGWHAGACGESIASSDGSTSTHTCHCSVFMTASSGASSSASTAEADADLKVWCPECRLNFVIGQTVQDYSCPNCHAALLPRV